ncbi:cytochrome P450 [Apiospora aurea]|uniref:Cytochrome P450 n=1 Tax=Apiospora aurea TaxID=335848 RepID=A0ABR1QPK7_9PEZI
MANMPTPPSYVAARLAGFETTPDVLAMITYVVSLILSLVAIHAFFYILLWSTQDAREAPTVDTGVPFLSALVYIEWQGLRYWDRHAALSESMNKPDINGTRVNMREWIDKEITMATTDAIYGPLNPFRDPKAAPIWPDYEGGLAPLLLNILPAITARRPAKAREALVRACERYYARGGQLHGSAFIKHRCEFYLSRGVPFEDIARIEVGAAIGLISNTKPAAFWLPYHVCSDPTLLESCRQELMSKAVRVEKAAENSTLTIDMTCVKSSCPILLSAFKETFRFHSMSISIRQVVGDDVLDSTYLLKKGSYLLIPAAVQHGMKSVWGEDVGRSDPTRFLQKDNNQKGRRPNPAAFRGFGGGSTLCPGRHFATTEILAFVAMAILRFDIRPQSGRWVMPTVGKSKPGIALHRPDQDLEVELVRRDGREVEWRVTFSGAGGPMRMSADDGGAAVG